jgi:hypothetical protein
MRVRAYLERKAKQVGDDLLWDHIALDFLALVLKEPETMCWLWQGALDHDGYAKISVNGKWHRVQRLVCEMFSGPIPPGEEVHHICQNKSCVSPAHLLALTPQEHRKFHPQTWPRSHSSERRHRDPEHVRTLERAKYARRIARDPEGFRAKRRAVQARYCQNKKFRSPPGVQIDFSDW